MLTTAGSMSGSSRTGERVAESFTDRVQLGVSPHAPYSASPDLYRACADLGLPVATHLAESEAETQWLLDGAGPWR